jgi:Ser/Thr protein kinase RdoA (MazF antagonist)
MRGKPDRAQFSAASAAGALVSACAETGLNPTGARLIRLGENAIYELPREGVVARVARSTALADRVLREVRIADWLAEQDYPAVRTAADVKQAIEADGRLVTFWQLVPPNATQPTVADLGCLLRRLHDLPAPSFPLPVFDPLSVVPGRLACPGAAPPDDVAFLRDRYEELAEAYRTLPPSAPHGLIHGDAHRGNVLMSAAGPLLSDFETAALGPREWDLTPTAMSVERFALDAHTYAAFVDAYGQDVRDWAGFGVLRQIREITMTTWLMQLYEVSDQHAAEFRLRVDSLREGDDGRLWHAA